MLKREDTIIYFEVVHYNNYNDKELLQTFHWSIEKCSVSREVYSTKTMKKVFCDMLHKLCHTRTKEFFRGKIERELASSGKVVDAHQSLKDNMTTCSVTKKVIELILICLFLTKHEFKMVLSEQKFANSPRIRHYGGP